jgi:glycosyltransferase involved in cell wall biosynthesis
MARMAHILMFSIDSTLAEVGSASWRRHSAYAAALADAAGRDSRITVITKLSGAGRTVSESAHLTVLTTCSQSSAVYLADAVRLARERLLGRVDLITSQDPFASGAAAWWTAKRRAAPFMLQNFSTFFDNPAWLNEQPLRNRALMALARFLRAQADFYRVSNRVEYDSYVRSGGDPRRCAILPVSTASASFSSAAPEAVAAARAALGVDEQTPLVLWVGHPVGFKRMPVLFAIFRRVLERMPSARLALVGDMTRSPDDLAALARAHGIDSALTMCGPVAHEALPAYYAAGWVYVHTSSYEGVPRVLMEASAAGLPLVGIDAPGISPILRDGVNGWLIPEGEGMIEAFAARVIELLRDRDLARRMGAAGQRIALEEFSAEAYTRRLVALWLDAIALGRRK